MHPLSGSERCFNHAVETARDRAEARRKGGLATRTPHLFEIGKDPSPLRDVASVQALLETVVHETRVQPNGPERSRALGSLLTIALRALEVGELEERIAALEAQVHSRARRTA
jgi:hypothetical protein